MTEMLMRATRYDQRLLREGTGAGPVTEEMIVWAKTEYVAACRRGGYRPDRHGWHDFLPGAREHFGVGGREHDEIPPKSTFSYQPAK